MINYNRGTFLVVATIFINKNFGKVDSIFNLSCYIGEAP
jgi:hypothetical protein